MSPPLLDPLVGITFCAVGLGTWRRVRPELGVLIIATGTLWLIGGPVDAAVFAHRGPLIHLLVGYPRGRPRDRIERAAVTVGYVDAAVYPIGRSGVATIVLAAGIGAVALRGYRRSRGTQRPARLASLVASALVFGVLAVGAAARFALSGVDHQILLTYEAALIVSCLVLLVDVRWGRSHRGAISTLAVDLGRTGAAGSLRDRLANALGDPTLVLGYVNPDSGRLVDEMGRSIEIEPDEPARTGTPIYDCGHQIALLVHDNTVLDDAAVLASVAALTKLAMANVRLQAEVEHRVLEVEVSRRRLVSVADAERVRLEGELQSGALRRLELVAPLLAGIREQAPELAEQLAISRSAIRDSAGGIYPRVLVESGLGVAISQLASTAPVPVAVSVPTGRFRPEVAAAAYFVCAEGLTNIAKYARASAARIELTHATHELIIEISDDGVGGADPSNGSGLVGLSDRLDVLGGTIAVDSPAGRGTRVEAHIPLLDR